MVEQNFGDDWTMDLDILGQQPGLSNLYTQICLCYPLAGETSHSAILDTLRKGLQTLSASFPWTAGQVCRETAPQGQPDVYKMKPLAKTPLLVVKDYTNDPSIPSMDALRKANFPIKMLDENTIAPFKTLAAGSAEVAESSPVFALQANLVKGGLLLTFVSQHNVMDMTGHGQIMYLLSKACHGEEFTPEELSSGNAERRGLVQLLDESYQPGPELDRQIAKPVPKDYSLSNTIEQIEAPTPPPNCSWAYFTWSASALAALKSLATKTMTLSSGFVSTDDALSAFIWQGIARARLPRLTPSKETTFARAIDPRRYLDVSPTYTGLIQNMTYQTYTIQDLLKEPLGAVASHLRLLVDPKVSKVGYNTRALMTYYDRVADKNSVNVTISLDLGVDIMLSSWSKVDCYQLDYNLGLGKPECVRRPQFVPVESLLYLMPKALDGEIAAALCLRDEDMQRLKEDKEFTKYATFVG